MAASPRDARSERTRTDESLAKERGKTDAELERRAEAFEETADDVLAEARRRADDVVVRARSRADEKLQGSGRTADERVALETERQNEDDALRDERATEDEKLATERQARRRALIALLALEREQTDHHLLSERGLVDAAIGSRDEFLAIVSHDMRNLLGGTALGAASLLNIQADEEVRHAIERYAGPIQRYVARMSRLVGDLLDLASIEAGRMAVVPQRHDAAELLRETLEVFRPIASAKNISIAGDVRAGSLLARYDHERVLQVLANLVGNAVKFTQPSGKIEIVVEPRGDEVRFAIADTGPGIRVDRLAVIFERFWQVHETERSGLGLGLYISRCIIEAHGGKIWAESREGAGSTFYFTLPAAASPSTPDETK